ncbi:unnamed protein product [marine sediment metagenome]|uniref:Uncharacterized protein n=1 Tax=marine sediment metagenome TaxID=412755 RepID=X0VP33_9ZZZZ
MNPFGVYSLKPEVLMEGKEEVLVRMRVSDRDETMCTVYPDMSDMNVLYYTQVESFNMNYDKVDYINDDVISVTPIMI